MSDENLKRQLEEKKRELTVQFQRQSDIFQSNIAALDSAILVIDGKTQPKQESGKLRDEILEAIKACQNEFSIRDVSRIIALRNPGKIISQSSLAGSFWKIVTEELKCPIVTPGVGRNPTLYAKVK
jgi:hypothetical protein